MKKIYSPVLPWGNFNGDTSMILLNTDDNVFLEMFSVEKIQTDIYF